MTGAAGPLDPKYITLGVARCQNRFRKLGIAKFSAHDLRRTGSIGLGWLAIRWMLQSECSIMHEKIHAAYDSHDYLDEKRDALENRDKYLKSFCDNSQPSVKAPPNTRDPTPGCTFMTVGPNFNSSPQLPRPWLS